MRLTVVAVGRTQDKPLAALWARYAERLKPPLALRVVDDKRRAAAGDLKQREARLVIDALPDGARMVALDERGKALDSVGLARQLGRWRDQGARDVAFVIGGADGLDRAVIERADLVLSLGPLTWPHQLVRVMLAEQLYRADTILSGHPYHRA
ncbi:MAG TPA: 23S rRNA (pseudouridine(1915)-N(3))-methyltransferase RlmH [Candidatus Sulfotelmatobacter sp.]|nr:23S rRNA (pseudouridine(1915)-N(3))-methyltransferase RlmH [Candidatus Sulfotelmatobacter sp.]